MYVHQWGCRQACWDGTPSKRPTFTQLTDQLTIEVKRLEQSTPKGNDASAFGGRFVHANTDRKQASDPHLDLIRVPYCLYGVKHIDLASLAPVPGRGDPKPAGC